MSTQNGMLLKPEGSKELNRRLILEQVRRNGAVSRSEIVHFTGLSKAAVSSIVGELMDAGLVEEKGSQSTTIGRPRILLSLVPGAGTVLGAELTEQECRVVATDLAAHPLQQLVRPVVTGDLSVGTLMGLLQTCVDEVVAQVVAKRVFGLGVCVPGMVNPTTSTVSASVLLPWRNVNLQPEFDRRFAFPTALFSRGSAATWGELWYGVGKNARDMLYVRVGSGIVAGLVINGQPYMGQGFGAGELGHVTVKPDGELCRCGNRGCLATVTTVDALLKRTRELLRDDPANPIWDAIDGRHESLKLDDVLIAADAGNPVALTALEEVGSWLALALASAVNLLNLDMIIVGGPLEQAGEKLLAPLRRELGRRALPPHATQVQVVSSALKEHAPSIGAASLILHELMSAHPLPIHLANFAQRSSLFTVPS